MTNAPPIAAPLCCPTGGGGDIWPLLWVVIGLLAGQAIFREYKKRKGKPEMKNFKNLAIVAAAGLAVGIVFALKYNQAQPSQPAPATAAEAVQALSEAAPSAAAPAALPRLVDLGADKCIPCKLMAPILTDLRTTYAGQLQVEFIDVWKNPDAGKPYGIRTIPTQIFYDARGRELFRHEGFFPKEDILAKWKELGVPLTAAGAPPAEAQVEVFYFHRTLRCPSCVDMETFAAEAVGHFTDAQKAGRLRWRVINLDDEGNRHFEQDYALEFNSVVLSRRVNGQEVAWTNLPDARKLIGDKPTFIAYIESEILPQLEQLPKE